MREIDRIERKGFLGDPIRLVLTVLLSDGYIRLIALNTLTQDVGYCAEKASLPSRGYYGAVHIAAMR